MNDNIKSIWWVIISSLVPFMSRLERNYLSHTSTLSPEHRWHPSLIFHPHDKRHCQKQLGDKRVYFSLEAMVYHWEKPGMKPKRGNWRQELKQRTKQSAAYWLTSRGLLSCPSYAVQTYLLMGSTVPSGLGPQTSARNQENDPVEMHMDQSDGANSSVVEIPKYL